MAMLRSKLVDQETQGEMPVTVFAEKGTVRVNGPASMLTEIVLVIGVTVTVKVAHVRLCHSRMLFVRAYPRETQEMVLVAY